VNRVDLLIFDLDGTLIDSRQDLADAGNAARVHMGMPPLADERVWSYVGNGAPVLVRRLLGADATESQFEEALEFFLEYYRDHMLDNTRLYPGVQEALDRLRESGVTMTVLTNKPVRVSRAILDGLGVGSHFRQVYGGNSFEFKKPHPIGIETLMTECGTGRERTMMVGDSSVDVQTARNAHVQSCGVTYGLQPESLISVPPDLKVERMEDLAVWVTSPLPSRSTPE
jgi:phosphoglycolate phosphatase